MIVRVCPILQERKHFEFAHHYWCVAKMQISISVDARERRVMNVNIGTTL